MSKVLLVYEDYAEMVNIQSVLKKVGFDVVAISSEFSLSQQILAFNPDIVVGYGKGPKVSTVGVGRRLREMPRWLGKSVLIFPAGSKPDAVDLARIRMDMALEAPLEVTRLLQVMAHFTGQEPQALVERMMKAVAQEAQTQAREGEAAANSDQNSPVFVSGGKQEEQSWDVKGGSELDEFNRLMGISPASESKSALKGGAAAKSPQFPLNNESKAPRDVPKTSLDVSGGNVNPEEQKAVDGDAGLAEAAASAIRQLKEAQGKLADKVKGYAKFMEGLVPSAQSAFKKTEARKAQKQLSESWSETELKNQDKLRRDFTRAMFKKKN